MAEISKKEVLWIARLARLELDPKEQLKFSDELNQILDFVDQLNEVDTENIKPIKQIRDLHNIFDEDEVKNYPIRDQILKNAPDYQNGYFKVKGVFE